MVKMNGFLCELNEIKKIKTFSIFDFQPNVKNKIGFRLKEKNTSEIIDELFIRDYTTSYSK